jgi:hypothetical protein
MFIDYQKLPATKNLPSHGRGHWFDPSTAHHKLKRLLVRTSTYFWLYGCEFDFLDGPDRNDFGNAYAPAADSRVIFFYL